MSLLAFDRLVSSSSEDADFPASNLVISSSNGVAGKPWKSHGRGEKQASVVLLLKHFSRIERIDIGNFNSALLQIDVAKLTHPDKYESILPMRSILSAEDSKSVSINPAVNVVMIDKSSMDSEQQLYKWNFIRLTLQQPFNKSVQYGLSFLRVFGTYTEQSPDTTSDSVSALRLFQEVFGNQQTSTPSNSPNPKKPRMALPASPLRQQVAKRAYSAKYDEELATPPRRPVLYQAVLESPNTISESPPCIKEEPPFVKESPLQVNSSPLQFVNSSPLQVNESPADIPETQLNVSGSSNSSPLFQHSGLSSPATDGSGSPLNARNSSPGQSPVVTRQCNTMQHIRFSLSGFVNPLRNELRGKLLSMGAWYEPDWTRNCTHLMLAFAVQLCTLLSCNKSIIYIKRSISPSTPKARAARRSQTTLVVSKGWVNACFGAGQAVEEDIFLLS